MKLSVKKAISLILIVLLIIALNYILHSNETFFLKLEAYGYIGTFLVCLLLNATILLPSSSTAVVMSMATIYNPVLVAVLGALGTTLGEFTGYFTGFYGRSVIGTSSFLSNITSIYNKFPEFAIVLFAILPLPFFDFLGILAGSVKMKKRKFFILCFIGKGIKMIIYACLGVYAYDQIQTFVT